MFKYRLRTLFIVQFVLALFLGCIGWWLQNTERQRAFVATLRDLNAKVMYDNDYSEVVEPPSDFLSRWLGQDAFHSPRCLSIETWDCTDAFLQRIGDLNQLEVLEIYLTPFHRDLSFLRKLKKLENLVTDDGDVVLFIGGLDKLTDLSVTPPTPEEVEEEAKYGFTVKYRFDNTGQWRMEQKAALAKLQQLRTLNVAMFDEDMVALASLLNLEELHIGCSKIDGSGFVHLRNCQNLCTIDCQATNVSDDNLKYLGSLPNLIWINLSGTKLKGPGLSHLCSLQKLEYLDISSTECDDDSVLVLGSIKTLKELRLTDHISPECLEKLRKMLPKAKIYQ